jgi:hypothetical protein
MACKLPITHPVHDNTSGSVKIIHGTVTPKKLG